MYVRDYCRVGLRVARVQHDDTVGESLSHCSAKDYTDPALQSGTIRCDELCWYIQHNVVHATHTSTAQPHFTLTDESCIGNQIILFVPLTVRIMHCDKAKGLTVDILTQDERSVTLITIMFGGGCLLLPIMFVHSDKTFQEAVFDRLLIVVWTI